MGSWSRVQLDALVAEAIVDCYDEDEQLTGLFTMMESYLAIPLSEPPPGGAEWIEAFRGWAR